MQKFTEHIYVNEGTPFEETAHTHTHPNPPATKKQHHQNRNRKQKLKKNNFKLSIYATEYQNPTKK